VRTPPPRGVKAVLRIGFGILLIIVGIIGLILPIMPGWVFIIPGLMILGDYFPPARRLLDWAKGKFAEARQAVSERAAKGKRD
jgi:uncharacterized membrane protein YbaN (DUF454 family)